MRFNMTWDDWEGFVPISFAPGLGGEFFAHLIYHRHEPFDINNFKRNNAGKFSFVNEEKPLKWNSDKSLLGWFMKSHYVNTPADHDALVSKLGLSDKFLTAFKDTDDFNRIAFAIANYCVEKGGSKTMDVNNPEFMGYIKDFDYTRTISFNDYQLAVIHPLFRWFDDKPLYQVFPNAKAIQLTCDPKKGWLFYLLSFSKMYDYYIHYAAYGETFRKDFFADLETNFAKRIDTMYSKYFCLNIKRPFDPNISIDSYNLFFKGDMTELNQIPAYLKEDFKFAGEASKALSYYHSINMAILDHYELDPKDDFVQGKYVFDKFLKNGPFRFKE